MSHRMHYSSRRYSQLIEWVACNDSPGDNEPLEEVACSLTVTMLAQVFNIKREDVAADVMVIRAEYLASLEGQP